MVHLQQSVRSIVSAPLPTRALALTRQHTLLLVLLAALALRVYGVGWDGGYLFHPDERAILTHTYDMELPPVSDLGVLLDAEASPWNPRWFPYGSLPLYLLKSLQIVVSPVIHLDLVGLSLAGRAVSAVADVGSVLMVFLLGRRLFERRTALLAAGFTALAVVHIQLSHFYAVDTVLTLFVLAAVFFMVRLVQDGRLRDSALAGGFVALALATKVSAAPILLPLFLAHLFLVFRGGGGVRSIIGRLPAIPRQLWRSAAGLGLSMAVLVVVLLVAAPYAFLDFGRFFADVVEQSEMVRGIRDYPYTRQYADTTSYLYQARQLALFGLGAPLGVVAWAGLVFAVGSAAVRRRPGEALALAWVIPLLLLTGAFQVKFLRYLLPATPFLLLYGARMLVVGLDWTRAHRPGLAGPLRAATAFVVLSTGFYALAYVNIYSEPHPAVRTSRWLNEQAESGLVLLKEHWEEGLPDLHRHRTSELPMYEPDSQRKTETVAGLLANADYLLFYSSRLYGTIPRLPERYPVSTGYYQMLFQGDLGYEVVRVEQAYPSLLGIAFTNDTFSRPGLPVPTPVALARPAAITIGLGFADESFSVYDHPRVLVLHNVGRLPAGQIEEILTEGPHESRFDEMLMPSGLAAAQRAGGTWSDIAPEDGLGARFPLVVWLAVVYAGSLAVTPLALVVFRGLPDRGYLLARPMGLLLLAYAPWLLASLGWAPFGRGTIALGFAALLGTSAWLAVRFRHELTIFVRRHWRLLLAEEAIFLGAILAFTLVRMANPDLWHAFRGGEKPMDLAYLNAVVRSTFMPPYDPWFSGGSLNYYYFGQFMVATLVRATGIPTAIAYNLAVPTLFALTATTAFSLGYNLAEGARRAARLAWPAPRWSAAAAGTAAMAFAAILGNLGGAGQILKGGWERIVDGAPFPSFDFWAPTRMMPPDPPGFEITEFPFFTFLFGDLHAHMMAMPLALLAIGLSLNALLVSRPGVGLRRFAASLALLSLTVGALWATNAWDFPAYLGLGAVALVLGEYLRRRRVSRTWPLRALAATALFAVLAVLLWLPYHLRLDNAYAGVVETPAQTALWQYLAIHGPLLFPVLTLLALALPLGLRGWLRRATELQRWAVALVALGVASGTAAAGLVGHHTIAFILPLEAATTAVGLRWAGAFGRPVRGSARAVSPTAVPWVVTPLLLLGLALGIGIGVELVAVRGDIDRMNTVFKLYLEAWLLLSIASAFALWYVGFARGLFRRVRLRKGLWLAALALLLAGAAVYPAMGTGVRLADRFQPTPLTLDGTAFMEGATYRDSEGAVETRWDLEAIQWLQANLDGSPVIVEGRTPLYRWGGRVSIHTGLPAVVGWDWHQKQQRCGVEPCPAVDARARDVDRIYSTTDPREAMRLLRKYGVAYLYVGETERLYYAEEGLDKLRGMEEAGDLVAVYTKAEVTVYAVAP